MKNPVKKLILFAIFQTIAFVSYTQNGYPKLKIEGRDTTLNLSIPQARLIYRERLRFMYLDSIVETYKIGRQEDSINLAKTLYIVNEYKKLDSIRSTQISDRDNYIKQKERELNKVRTVNKITKLGFMAGIVSTIILIIKN